MPWLIPGLKPGSFVNLGSKTFELEDWVGQGLKLPIRWSEYWWL